MIKTEERLKTLVLGPHDHRSHEPLDVLGEPCLVKLAGGDTDNAVAVVHLTVPKLAGPPLHRHSREDEWFYVLDGELTCEVDGQRFIAGAGASAFAPRGTAHTYQNFNDEAAHLLVMVTPAGVDQFFEDVTALNKGLSQPDFAAVEKLMQSYGMELLGPPLSD
jgi:quercetin dioxygenase-like cupin family protein